MPTRIPHVDHLGQEFPSLSAMARHWGHTRARIYRRLQRGSSLEKALTTPWGGTPAEPIVDHVGVAHSSYAAMARGWKVHAQTLYARRRKGIAPSDPRFVLRGRLPHPHYYQDILGDQYPSLADLAEAWGLDQGEVVERVLGSLEPLDDIKTYRGSPAVEGLIK